jgi:MtN3 and saliva related transmembrane protein
MEEILGYLAAFCTTVAFIPQAMQVYKSKETKDISLWMFIIFNLGIVFWLLYGLMIKSYPIIVANATTLIFAMYVLITKIKLDVLHHKG